MYEPLADRLFAGLLFSALFSEKSGEQQAAFLRQNTSPDGGFRVKQTPAEQGESPFGVRGSKHDFAQLHPVRSRCAHGAGFKGNIQGAVVQIFTAKVVGC